MNLKPALIQSIFSAILLLATQVNAQSDIPLDSVQAKPGKELKIALAKLYDQVSYTVNCMIKLDDVGTPTSKTYIELFVQNGFTNIRIYIDGKLVIQPSDTPSAIKSQGSLIEFHHVRKNNESLIIRNLDYTHDIFVSDCIASIETY